MGHGANASAAAYMELRLADGTTLFGVGLDKNIVVASLKAAVSGLGLTFVAYRATHFM